MSVEAPPSSKPLGLRRPRKRTWWYLLGGAVVIALGVGVYAKFFTHPAVNIPPGDYATVSYGNVVQTISAAGTIQPLQSINLNFSGASGVLATVNASLGQHVHAGQVLATLNDSTDVPAVQSAQASVAAAQATLLQDEAGATPQQIAVAQAAVQKAQVALAGAEQQYKDQQAVDSNHASAQQAILNAENTVQQAQGTVASDQAAVSAAQVKLQQAQAAVSTSTVNSLPATITAAEAAVTAAQKQETADTTALTNDQNSLTLAQQTLTTDQATLAQDQTLYGTLAGQYPADETAYQNAMNDYNSWHGYGSNPYSSEVSTTSQAASAAQSAYNTIQSATTAVQNDQTAVQTDTKNIQDDEASIQSTKATVSNDQAQLTSDQDQQASDQANNPLSVSAAQVSLQQAQTTLANAESSYTSAEASLQATKNVEDNTTTQKQALDADQNNIASAKNGVTSAEASLAETEAAATPAQIASAKASLQSAEAQLASAKVAQSDTVLTAPVSGVIVASNYLPGDTFSAANPVFVLDDSLKSNLQDSVEVSEADIAQVKPGEKVTVSAASYPNATFSGTVLEVEPTPTVVNDVTEYTVLTSVNNSSGDLLPGMTTSVSIQTASASHVLTIPAVALQSVGTQEGVYIYPDSPQFQAHKKNAAKGKKFSGKLSKKQAGVIFVPVKVGLFGSTSVQISKGVYPGEQILLVDPASLKLPVAKGFHFGPRPGGRKAFGGHGGGHK